MKRKTNEFLMKLMFNLSSMARGVKSVSSLVVAILLSACVVTGCSDDESTYNNDEDPVETVDSTAVSLTYHNFTANDDVLILDADTTQISVSKALAEKLGIKHFNGRPMAIWQKVSRLPFIRRATSERIDGDRYILTVDKSASLADVLPNTEASLDTKMFVNPNAASAYTRAGGSNLVEDISARYMDGDTIHPAAILYTDPRGYDNDVIPIDEDSVQTSNLLTRASATGEYQYITPEAITRGSSNWSIINKSATFSASMKYAPSSNAEVSVGLKLPIEASMNAKIEINTKWFKLQKFDMGIYGGFSFKPEMNLKITNGVKIPSSKGTKHIADFPGYTAVFMVGVVPVWITINPGIIFKINGSLKGSVSTGLKCSYVNNSFKAGVKYEGSWGAYGERNIKENTFSMDAIKYNAKIEAGVGFYLSVSTLIYGSAGPELAVGPSLSVDASASTTTSWNGSSKVKFDASADLGVKALIGAKLKILKWTLAEWNTTFSMGPQWTIWKCSKTFQN